ncbi:DUF2490 domain-containing protein [Bacteroides sp.]
MNRNIVRIGGLIILLINYGFSTSYAQDDFTTWTSMKVSHEPISGLAVVGKLELRTQDSMKSFDRWGAALETNYRILSFLKIEAGYEIHYRDRGDEGWKFRHRYRIGATGSVKWQQFNFSLREYFQQTFDEGELESRLRSRLKIAYEPDKWKVSPYFSTELYQAIGDAAFWDVMRMRYRPGVEFELSKKWNLDLFYCYQYEPDKSKHIVGVECRFTF